MFAACTGKYRHLRVGGSGAQMYFFQVGGHVGNFFFHVGEAGPAQRIIPRIGYRITATAMIRKSRPGSAVGVHAAAHREGLLNALGLANENGTAAVPDVEVYKIRI